MLFLTVMMLWSILFGIMKPMIVPNDVCTDAGVCY